MKTSIIRQLLGIDIDKKLALCRKANNRLSVINRLQRCKGFEEKEVLIKR